MMQMKRWERWASLAVAFCLTPAALAPRALAQAGPTATQRFGLSVFGAGSGVYTDVFGGRNLSLTAGADLTLRSYYGLTPSFELRGTYPLHSGHVATEKSVLLGLKVEKSFGRFHPYGDLLVGRGQIDYLNGGIVSGPFIYNYSSSAIYSPGLGVDLDLSPRWALKADYQHQLWTTYPLESGILKPNVLTGGVVYRFDFNHHYKAPRHPAHVVEPPAATPPPQSAPPTDAAPTPPPQ